MVRSRWASSRHKREGLPFGKAPISRGSRGQASPQVARRLLNDLISPRKERGRHIEPEGFRGLHVDHQLVARRCLDREVGGPGSDMPQQHALASFWRASGYSTRQDAPCFYFSITASAAVIRSSSGSLMQCSVSLALSDNSFSTSITAGSCSYEVAAGH